MSGLKMFLPITKVDAAHRLVFGVATGETPDRAGEICDFASTRPHYEAWSGDISKASGGKSLGNLRAMHGKVAAGKITAIEFNDEAKQIEVCAKVVDDAEWEKVQQGVYTGFSQGGSYAKRWKDEATGFQRYTAVPSEISLVDLPCLPEATFEMIKAAGVEKVHFKSVVTDVPQPTNADVLAKAEVLAKAAGKETQWADFLDPARDALIKAALPQPAEMPAADTVSAETVQPTSSSPGDGVEQVWKAKDGTTFAKKADALAHNAVLDDPATKGVLDQIAGLQASLGIDSVTKAAMPWSVSSTDSEGKKKTSSHATKDAATAEATSRDKAGHKDIAMTGDDGKPTAWKSDKAAGGELGKRGARNNSSDQGTIQEMHDHACKLGATCDADNCDDEDDDMENAQVRGDLSKTMGVLQKSLDAKQAELDAANARAAGLQKTIADMGPMLATIIEKVGNIERQPLPLPFQGGTHVVSKGGDNGSDMALQEHLAKLERDDPEAYRLMLFKAAQSNPQKMSLAPR